VNGQSPRDFNLIVFINIQRQEFLDYYVSPTAQPEETRLLLSNVPASLLLVFGVLEDTGALKSSILEIDLSPIEYFVHLELTHNISDR
jgi:hypothetical protein